MTLISVIIPTFNKSPLVCDTVRNLHSQTLQDFEVIVVDDGSADDTVKQMKKMRKEERHLKIKIFQTGMSDQFGMCHAINMGLKNASGPISLLLNDDIYLHSTCLEQHALAHKRIRSRHAFIGPRFKSPPYQRGQLYIDKDTQRQQNRRYIDRSQPKKYGYGAYRKKMMVSSNFSISTDKLCKIGGYNPYFTQYTGAIDRDVYNRMVDHRIGTFFLFQAQAYSVNYENDLLKQTMWLKDTEFRDGLGVVDWKRQQMRYTIRRERKARKYPPDPIIRRRK